MDMTRHDGYSPYDVSALNIQSRLETGAIAGLTGVNQG